MITKEDIDLFYNQVESLGLKFPVASIAKTTGFSKGNVSDYLNKRKEPSENFIKIFREKFSTTKVPQVTESDLSASSILKIAQSNMILAEANKTLADAHIILARNNENLIGMVKTTTESVGQEIPPVVLSKLTDLLGLIAEVGSGKRWKSLQEADAELHRRFVGTVKKKKVAGIQNG